MKYYDFFIEQVKSKQFKPLLYMVYNTIDDNGYVNEVSARDKCKYDIDDFEYIKLDINEKDIKGLKYNKRLTIRKFKKLKFLIETNKDNSIPNVYLDMINDLGFVFVVKLKKYSLSENLFNNN